MKISMLEQAMRAFMDSRRPALAVLGTTGALAHPGLAEFATAANTLAERVDATNEDPEPVPLNWI